MTEVPMSRFLVPLQKVICRTWEMTRQECFQSFERELSYVCLGSLFLVKGFLTLRCVTGTDKLQ